jgi:hypothetical protein
VLIAADIAKRDAGNPAFRYLLKIQRQKIWTLSRPAPTSRTGR